MGIRASAYRETVPSGRAGAVLIVKYTETTQNSPHLCISYRELLK